MKRSRQVKIVATLGPATSTPDAIERLFECGADVFRINMSHTSPEQLREIYKVVRDVQQLHSHPIGILADLQGPKLRVGQFETDHVMLMRGQIFDLVSADMPGTERQVTLPHPEIFASVEPGQALLVNDGKIRLRIKESPREVIRTTVELGGELSARKAVNLPDTIVPVSAMTDKEVRPGSGLRCRGGLAGPVIRPATRQRCGGSQAGSWPGRPHGQDRKAGGAGMFARNP